MHPGRPLPRKPKGREPQVYVPPSTQINFIASDGKRMQIAADFARNDDIPTAVLYERVGDAYKVVKIYEGDDARTAVNRAKLGTLR